jgi:hypothetical protein
MKTKQLSVESIVCQGNETLSSAIDDETVLLSIKNSKYYGMDAIASKIWNLTAHPIKVTDIIHILQSEYNIGEDQCAHDVLSFLQELFKEKLIFIQNEIPV